MQRDPRDVARIAQLEAKLEAALKRIEDLEEQLRSSSRNSSQPPSSDPPTVPRDAKPPTGRKPGGQPGHKRHQRQLFPPEKLRSITECKPARCGNCHHRLRGEDRDPIRHQAADLPKVEPIVDEYQLHALSPVPPHVRLTRRCRTSCAVETVRSGRGMHPADDET